VCVCVCLCVCARVCYPCVTRGPRAKETRVELATAMCEGERETVLKRERERERACVYVCVCVCVTRGPRATEARAELAAEMVALWTSDGSSCDMGVGIRSFACWRVKAKECTHVQVLVCENGRRCVCVCVCVCVLVCACVCDREIGRRFQIFLLFVCRHGCVGVLHSTNVWEYLCMSMSVSIRPFICV